MLLKKDQEKKQLKNYLILAIIFVLTGFLTLYLCNCYTVYNDSKKEIPVIRDTLFEITSKELEHYLLENPTTTIYMCTASDEVCRNYEKSLIKLVKQNDLTDKIVYLNLSNEVLEDFVKNFNDKYPYKVKLTSSFPALVNFDDGELTNILQESNKKLTIKKTKQFIEINKIGE